MGAPDEYSEKRWAAAQIFKGLALEMLELAALDLSRPKVDQADRSPAGMQRRSDRQSAEMWIAGAGDRGVVSFALCCDALGAPVERIRDALTSDPSSILRKFRAFAATASADDVKAEQGARAVASQRL